MNVEVSGVALELVNHVLSIGSYISPSSPCGVREYNISFEAPALQCQDITDTLDVPDSLPFTPNNGSNGTGTYTVWNATYQRSESIGLEYG